MTIREFDRRFCPLSILGSVVIMVLCLLPVPEMKHIPLFPGFDKIVHGAFYSVLTLLIVAESRRPWLAFVWSALWGGLIEILQAYCTHGLRSGEWGDWLADILGAMVVCGMYVLIGRRYEKSQTNRF